MKNMKERQFVKEANEVLKEEVNVSRIIILESSSNKGIVTDVMYEDRFGRQWQVAKRNEIYTKQEFVKQYR